jgi:hypothetical protein
MPCCARRPACSPTAVLFTESGRPRFSTARRGLLEPVCPDAVDAAHRRPPGASDRLVEANGTFSEALEFLERARGQLYAFHQLVGRADLLLDDVVAGLCETGHDELARRVEEELIGRNVLAGRWSFQIVEEFDAGYCATFRRLEKLVRDETLDGRRHVFEAETKQRRRTSRRPGHEATPDDV